MPRALDLDSSLLELPPSALRTLCGFLQRLIAALSARAALLEEQERRRRQVERLVNEHLPGLGLRALERARETGDVPAAIAAIACEAGVPLATVEAHYRLQMRDQLAAELHERNVMIMRMAGRGWSNAAIAKRLELHPSTVSRIVRRGLGQGGRGGRSGGGQPPQQAA